MHRKSEECVCPLPKIQALPSVVPVVDIARSVLKILKFCRKEVPFTKRHRAANKSQQSLDALVGACRNYVRGFRCAYSDERPLGSPVDTKWPFRALYPYSVACSRDGGVALSRQLPPRVGEKVR